MTEKLHFKEKSTLGEGWSLEVWQGRIVLLGHIRKNASTGDFRYFNGPQNFLTATLEDPNLDVLKEKVAARYAH